MSLSSMASFSDAHECVEIPIIAANLHRAILPRQSQIWCVIRRSDSVRRISYSVAAAFLGRMCLSGDVTDLTSEQWAAIDGGIAFYKSVSDVIKSGKTRRFGTPIKSERHPQGYQAVLRSNGGRLLCVVHSFSEAPDKISIELDGNYRLKAEYNHTNADINIKNSKLSINRAGDFGGYGMLLEKI